MERRSLNDEESPWLFEISYIMLKDRKSIFKEKYDHAEKILRDFLDYSFNFQTLVSEEIKDIFK